MGPTLIPGQATTLLHAFVVGTLHDPFSGAWNMDTGASSHHNDFVTNLSHVFNSCMYPSVSVGDDHSIPVTNTGHSILPTSVRPLHLNNVLITLNIVKNLISVRQFVRDNNCTIEFVHDSSDGTLSRYKARLVTNGSTQLEGVDIDETFSLVVKPGTIQTVLSLAASRHWSIHQIDVKNSFLHGDLSETVYMHQPPRFQDSVHPNYGTDTAYLLLYVDDIVHTASSNGLLQRIISSLHQEFAMTDLGVLYYFLGISVMRDSSSLFLSQKKYDVEILEKAHMVNCNPGQTPVDAESKLGVNGDSVSDPTLYQSLAGSLQYLTFTRPDLSYAVQQVCLHMHDPREPHFSALKRILRYVQSTLHYGLQLYSSSTTYLVAYSDADWAGCPTTRRSTSGAEAEYRGVANAVAETYWLRNLLRELHTPLSSATFVYCDNVSAVYLSCNLVQHQRTKHIEIDIHFVRDLVVAGQVRVLHVPSRYHFADIFTKELPSSLFEEFRSSLSVRCSPAPTAREC
ncbi:ribonuclease H-like domain-containing protein [Tanacetum coccineum]